MRLLLKNVAKPQAQLEMIENPCHAMWKDARFLQMLEQKLGKDYGLLISMLREIESIIISIASSLDIAVAGEGAKKGLKTIVQEGPPLSQITSSGKAVQLQQRAKFAWKRKKIKSEIKELIECNARLGRILTASNQLTETFQPVETSGKADVGFVGSLDDISRNAARVHAALLRSWCVLGGCTHRAGIMLEERRSRNVRSHTKGPMRPFGKAEHFSVSLWRDAVATWLNAEFRLDSDEICQTGQSRNRRVHFQPSHVLVSESPAQEVTDICTSIQQTARPELGYFIDSHNILHRLDRLDNPHGHLLKTGVSLHDLLPELRRQSFSLSDFYRLAITLASSVLQLRDTSWLHRSWSKQSILFFRPDPEGEASADISMGLRNRLALPPVHQQTEHLNMLGLAIMLMEIRTGTPIEFHRHPDDLGSDGGYAG
ncbi:hypothetical protein FMEXI_6837 [Fusarium mexicanum]|uniref:DUF7580 domain-containing protein n=1 Tax=Fusarium mexicanum TaxID=751941 RepID=A0A8H5IXR9_9HYPO|nr:hypothetical protein FMEXI_6837 [Fusarium mexicanum]